MPLDQGLIERIRNGTYRRSKLDLSNRNVSDADIILLVQALQQNPRITELDLRNNNLTNASANRLAANTTLRTLRLKPGNSHLTITGMDAFLNNTTLTTLPIVGGSGPALQRLRAHIVANHTRPAPVVARPPIAAAPRAAPIVMQPPILVVQPPAEPRAGLIIRAPALVVAPPLPVVPQPIEQVLEIPVAQVPAPAVVPGIPPARGMPRSLAEQTHLNNYMNKRVGAKRKLGQGNFTHLLVALLYDLDIADLSVEQAIVVAAMVMGFCMQNSTYRPLPGYGKAQDAAAKNPNLYYRAQTDHSHRRFFDRAVKAGDARKTSLLPRNTGFTRLVSGTVNNHDRRYARLVRNLNALDERGFIKLGRDLDDKFSLFLGYSGARANNVVTYQLAARHLATQAGASSVANLRRHLKAHPNVPKRLPNKITRLDNAELMRRITSLTTRFADLRTRRTNATTHARLARELFIYRQQIAQTIAEDANQAHAVRADGTVVGYQHFNATRAGTSVILDLYPQFSQATKSTRNYTTGVNKTLLAFLIGLINHLAKKNNLQFRVDRRPSFGFRHTTLTDVGGLRIRLSIGLESTKFVPIIKQALREFDDLLEVFDFRDRNNRHVRASFTKIHGVNASDKSDVRLTKMMRSEEVQWRAMQRSQQILDAQAPGAAYVGTAFAAYLNEVIVNGRLPGSSRRDNVSFITEMNVRYRSNLPSAEPRREAGAKPNVLFKLLGNTLSYALGFVANMPALQANSACKHTYWHSLFKLYKNCDKAAYLLEQMQHYEATHLQVKAQLLLDNMLEYLSSLQVIRQVLCEQQNIADDPCAVLRRSELANTSRYLGVAEDTMSLYFTDNGQQSLSTSLLIIDQHMAGHGRTTTDRRVYIFDDSYYELVEFIDKVAGLRTHDRATARILCIDITKLTALDFADLSVFPRLEAVVIDMTIQPNFSDNILRDKIAWMHARGIFVSLVGSTLKQKELGIDKYQAGQIITLPPSVDADLSADLHEQLEAISHEAMNKPTAAYLQMVHAICPTTVPAPPTVPPAVNAALQALQPGMGPTR